MHIRIFSLFLTALLAFCLITPTAHAEPSLEDEITALARSGDSTTLESIRALALKVRKNQARAFSFASKGLAKKKITLEERVTYIWTLGLTGREEAVKLILRQVKGDPPSAVRATAESALAEIGGRDAGRYLLKSFTSSSTEKYRLLLLNLMAQFHYAPALDKAEYLLLLPPERTKWESVFVFTKMGSTAVPWLIKRLDHRDRSIRLNAVMLLGQWLIAPEASPPLMRRYKKESEPEARRLILDAIERTTYDLKRTEAFMDSVARSEKDPDVRTFAEESIANAARMRDVLKARKADTKPNRKAFDKEYEALFESKGMKGDYTVLADAASASDEKRLIELREQVLRRRSSQALEAVQDINRAILIQRFLKGK
jgi:HEAT repeat protein